MSRFLRDDRSLNQSTRYGAQNQDRVKKKTTMSAKLADFGDFFRTGQFEDVRVRWKGRTPAEPESLEADEDNGETMGLHRIILDQRSGFFRQAFRFAEQSKSRSEPVVDLSQFAEDAKNISGSFPDVPAVFRFVYSPRSQFEPAAVGDRLAALYLLVALEVDQSVYASPSYFMINGDQIRWQRELVRDVVSKQSAAQVAALADFLEVTGLAEQDVLPEAIAHFLTPEQRAELRDREREAGFYVWAKWRVPMRSPRDSDYQGTFANVAAPGKDGKARTYRRHHVDMRPAVEAAPFREALQNLVLGNGFAYLVDILDRHARDARKEALESGNFVSEDRQEVPPGTVVTWADCDDDECRQRFRGFPYGRSRSRSRSRQRSSRSRSPSPR